VGGAAGGRSLVHGANRIGRRGAARRGLAAVLDERPPKLKEYVSQLVRARSSPAHQVTEIVEGFANAVGDVSTVSLFIDDYHVIAEEDVAEWFVHELQSRLASASSSHHATAQLGDREAADLRRKRRVRCGRARTHRREATAVLGGSLRSKGSACAGARVACGRRAAARTDAELRSDADAAAATLFRYLAEELFRAARGSCRNDC